MAQLTNSAQLDWTAALAAAKRLAAITAGPWHEAADRIVRSCESAAYTAPEALYMHAERVRQICVELNKIGPGAAGHVAAEVEAITAALLITAPPAVFS